MSVFSRIRQLFQRSSDSVSKRSEKRSRLTQRQYRRAALRAELLEERKLMASDLHYFVTTEHTDLASSYSGGWSLGISEEIQGNLPLDETLVYVGTNAQLSRPTDPQWDFTGVAANVPFFVGSQTQQSGFLYFGANASGVAPSLLNTTNVATESKNRVSGDAKWVKYSLLDVEHFNPDGTPGTGNFSLWSSGAFGTPLVLMSSYNDGVANPNGSGLDVTDGISSDDALWLPAGGHVHFNLGFTQAGRYEVHLQTSANFVSGGTIASDPLDPFILYFSVGSVGQLEFDSASYSVDESAGSATIRVERVGGSDGEITVNYAMTGVSATAGSDFTSSSGTMTFADKETEKFITIPIINDTDAESDETISLSLSLPGPEIIEAHYDAFESRSLVGAQSTAVLTILASDLTSNTPPSISDVSDQATQEDTATGAIAFTVNDAQTAAAALVVTATSSNLTLVPNGNIVFGGSGSNRTVMMTPALNQFGSTTITLTVTDAGGLTATDSFLLTVNPVNDLPTISDIADQTINENTTAGPLPFVIGDVESAPEALMVSVASTNLDLIPTSNIVIAGSGANRTIQLTPLVDQHGSSTITVTITDPDGGVVSDSFALNVDQVNEAPSATDDVFEVLDGSVFGNVLRNDTDADSPVITAALSTGPSKGTVILGADGRFVYTPGSSFDGSDQFEYMVSDGEGGQDTATVTINAGEEPTFIAGLVTDHADIGIGFEMGELEPHVHAHLEEEEEEEGGEEHEHGGLEYAPNEILIQVQSEGAQVVPNDPNYAFLGAAAGSTIYVLPTAPNPALPFLGFGTEEIEAATFDDGIKLELISMSGPGHLSIWDIDVLGAPIVHIATSDGVSSSDFLRLLEASHTHRNIGFSAPGDYAVTFRASAAIDGAPIVSEDVTYYFSVADGRAPVITLAATAQTYVEQGAAKAIDSVARLTDADSLNFDGGQLRVDIPIHSQPDDQLTIHNGGTGTNQISLNGADVRIGATGGPIVIGTFEGGLNGEPLVVSLNSNATPARVQILLRNIMFRNPSDNPTDEHRVVRFVVADGDGAISNATIREVLVTPVNDAPQVVTSVGSVSYVENGASTLIDSGISISDVDSFDLNTGRLTIAVSTNRQLTDRLRIAPQGNGAGEINTLGSDVLYEGIVIGTMAGGYTTSNPLVITFNANATPAIAEALAKRISFENAGDNPTGLTRTVSFTVSDGDGGTSMLATKLVEVTPANDAPVVMNSLLPATYVEGAIPVQIAPSGSITDADSSNFDGGSLTVSITSGGTPADILAIRSQGVGNGRINLDGFSVTYQVGTVVSVIGTWSGGDGTNPLVVSLNSNATPVALTALLRNVLFRVTGSTPTSSRVVQAVVNDGDSGVSIPSQRVINVIGVNNAPEVVTTAGSSTYQENDVRVVVDGGVSVSDVDSADFDGGRLTVSIGTNRQTTDRLTISEQGNGSGQVNVDGSNVLFEGNVIGTMSGGYVTSNPLVITFNSSATPAIAEAVARRIAFHNVGDNPTSLTRSVIFTVSDGDGKTSLASTKSLNVLVINDGPTIGNLGGTVSYTQNRPAIVVAGSALVTDPDSPNFDGGTLTVGLISGATAADVLGIRSQGVGNGRINVSGNSVTYGIGGVAVVIGTWTGGDGVNPLVIQFNSSASLVAVQATIRNITFSVVGNTPTSSRTVRFSLTDGDGGTSLDADKLINVLGT